tara:strand:- start:214 stop:408 length:195 start_codon:yes stop_codon:yes gene_type:complete
MAGTGVLFLRDIFLGQCTQKTKNKLIMIVLERRNFNKNGVTNTLGHSCSTSRGKLARAPDKIKK